VSWWRLRNGLSAAARKRQIVRGGTSDAAPRGMHARIDDARQEVLL